MTNISYIKYKLIVIDYPVNILSSNSFLHVPTFSRIIFTWKVSLLSFPRFKILSVESKIEGCRWFLKMISCVVLIWLFQLLITVTPSWNLIQEATIWINIYGIDFLTFDNRTRLYIKTYRDHLRRTSWYIDRLHLN